MNRTRAALALVAGAAVSALPLAAQAAAPRAVLVKYPVVYGPAANAGGLTVPNASPLGSNDWDCKPSPAHPRPVILVHGTSANMQLNWGTAAPLLKNNGYCVFAFNFGRTAATHGFFYALKPVPESGRELAAFVDKVLAATGSAKADFVGYSQGGMLPSYYVKFLGGAAKTGTIVGLAPSNHGTAPDAAAPYVRFFQRTAALSPGAARAGVGVFDSRAFQDQEPDSAFMTLMNSRPDSVPGVRYTVITSRFDEVVPPAAAELKGPGVRNISVQSLCPADRSSHFTYPNSRIALGLTLNALDPHHPQPLRCTRTGPVVG